MRHRLMATQREAVLWFLQYLNDSYPNGQFNFDVIGHRQLPNGLIRIERLAGGNSSRFCALILHLDDDEDNYSAFQMNIVFSITQRRWINLSEINAPDEVQGMVNRASFIDPPLEPDPTTQTALHPRAQAIETLRYTPKPKLQNKIVHFLTKRVEADNDGNA